MTCHFHPQGVKKSQIELKSHKVQTLNKFLKSLLINYNNKNYFNDNNRKSHFSLFLATFNFRVKYRLNLLLKLKIFSSSTCFGSSACHWEAEHINALVEQLSTTWNVRTVFKLKNLSYYYYFFWTTLQIAFKICMQT